MAACTKFVRRVWKDFKDNGGHDYQCFRNLVVDSARPNLVKCSLKIEPYNVNRIGTVHGGLIGSLVDTGGSLAVASRGFYMTGVSTDIHVTYVKAAGKPGDTINFEAQLLSMGKTLAFTRVNLVDPKTGEILAFGSHTKYIKRALESQKNVVFDEAGEKVVSGATDWDSDVD